MARAKLEDHQPHALSSQDTIALWRCDESTAFGNFTCATGNAGQTLARSAALPTVEPSLFHSSDFEGARGFNGSTMYGLQSVADPAMAANFQWAWGEEGGYTVEAWIKPATLHVGMILDLAASGETEATNQQFGLSINASGEMQVTWEYGAGSNVSAVSVGAGITAGDTHHVALVVDDDPEAFDKVRASFYVDGEFVSRVTGLTPPSGGTSAKWCIGASQGTSAFFNGVIDDVRVSRFAASPECIRYDYARGIRDFDENALARCPFSEHHLKVEVQDLMGAIEGGPGAGEFVDVTSLFGWSWVKEATVNEDADNQVQAADVQLVARIGELNMSPLAGMYSYGGAEYFESRLNWNGGAHFDSFLGVNRQVKISVATVPWGTGRDGAAPFYRLCFHGMIRVVEADDGSATIRLSCHDLGTALQDVWVEPDVEGEDEVYGSPSGEPIEEVIQQIIDDNDPARYTALLVGSVGIGSPLEIVFFDGTTALGTGRPHLLQAGDKLSVDSGLNAGIYTVDTVSDIGVTCVEGSVASGTGSLIPVRLLPRKGYMGGKPFLWVPTSPGYNLFERVLPSTMHVMAAVNEAPEQIGWKVGYRFDDHRQAYRLALFRPSFSHVGAIPQARVLKVPPQRIESLRPRTIIEVEFEDDAMTGTLGERQRRLVFSSDSDAAEELGRRIGRVGVGSMSNVNTEAEAQEMADNMLSDLSRPVTDGDWELMFEQWGEVGDFFTIEGEMGGSLRAPDRLALPTLYPTDQVRGMQGRSHTFSRGSATTRLRGRASSGASRIDRQFDFIQASGNVTGRSTRPLSAPGAPTCNGVKLSSVYGVSVKWSYPVNDLTKAFDVMEVHVSAVSGFTPSASTLAGVVRGSGPFIAVGWTSGATFSASTVYRCKLIARDRMGNVSSASSQATFSTPA